MDYLEKGGFPEYLKTGNTDILAQLQSDIVYRDIAVRYGMGFEMRHLCGGCLCIWYPILPSFFLRAG
jgi:predicted AAA+ superfamily ATPase